MPSCRNIFGSNRAMMNKEHYLHKIGCTCIMDSLELQTEMKGVFLWFQLAASREKACLIPPTKYAISTGPIAEDRNTASYWDGGKYKPSSRACR